MDSLNALGISAGAVILIPIIIITIKAIYWMCVFARLGDLKDNQQIISRQLDEKKPRDIVISPEIVEEMRTENQKLRATIQQNSALLIEIKQAIETTQKDKH